jgi:ABC-2 type transport system permease protein
MTKLLTINFLRSRGLIFGLFILFLSGLLSLYIGKKFLDNNQEIITKTAHFQKENIDRYVKFENKEMGLLLYYLKFGIVNEMPNLAGLSIGQRDVNPSVQSVTIRNLEEQKYNTDLLNPYFQMIGNLDFSFVLLFFFPLIIIAFCYNLLSEEKEDDTWNLVLSQGTKPSKILQVKILVRYFAILSVLIVLFFISKIYLQIPSNEAFMAFIMVSVFYISFWFGLCWLVISFQKNSHQNALILLVCWVIFLIIIPAATNSLLENLYPVPEAFETVVANRDGYHSQWDKDKQGTIQQFKKHYPQFASYDLPEGKDFNWFWYYAMQQMGDDEAAKEAKNLMTKMAQREQFSKIVGWFLPSIQTQLSLNDLSHSGLKNQLNYLEAIENFHEQKRLLFYPKIFSESSPLNENWKQFDIESFKDRYVIDWLKILFSTLIICVLCLLIANFKLNKMNST